MHRTIRGIAIGLAAFTVMWLASGPSAEASPTAPPPAETRMATAASAPGPVDLTPALPAHGHGGDGNGNGNGPPNDPGPPKDPGPPNDPGANANANGVDANDGNGVTPATRAQPAGAGSRATPATPASRASERALTATAFAGQPETTLRAAVAAFTSGFLGHGGDTSASLASPPPRTGGIRALIDIREFLAGIFAALGWT